MQSSLFPQLSGRRDFRGVILAAVVAAFLVAGGSTTSGGTPDLTSVFEDAPSAAGNPGAAGDLPAFAPAARRVRPVVLNAAVTGPGRLRMGDAIALDLFVDASYTATVDRLATNINGTFTLRARIDGLPLAYVLVSTTDGRTLGEIKVPEHRRRFAIVGEGAEHLLAEIDIDHVDELESAPALIPEPTGDPERSGVLADEWDPATIDVMVVYTPAALTWAGGAAGIANVIAQAMERAHLVNDNSDTRLTMNLVHTAQVDYTETESCSTDLQRLRNTGDGYIDEVHQWRNTFAADLVSMFTVTSNCGGIGYLLNTTAGSPTNGFSITRVQQAAWTYTHIHEMGHNMGAHHHKAQNVQPGPTSWLNWPGNVWSAGWRWVGNDGGRHCSIMTYESGQYFSDGQTHTRVALFSNPSITHAGMAAGHAQDGDNARTVRHTKHAVAAYRAALAWPDFLVHSIVLEPAGAPVGAAIQATVTVGNQGTLAADAGVLELYLDKPGSAAVGEAGDASFTVGTLAAGGTAQFIWEFAAPAPAGSKVFRAFIDRNNRTAESNEANNQSTLGYTVATPEHVLAVTRTGAGAGDVTSDPAGIDCGSACSALFGHGASVTLTAAAAGGSTFTGWSGSGCSGIGTCVVVMTEARAVTATFQDSSSLPGDVNGDGLVNAGDVFYLINYLFAGGPAPVGNGDVNGDGLVNAGDVFYLINYLFAGGPPPVG